MEGIHGTHKASKLTSEDVISSMPDNVITNIMNRLPIRYAVRTGILARNWRLKWTLLTQLVFNSGISSRIIGRLLLVLKGPITKFVLYTHRDQILDVGDFNHWVLFLSEKGIKEFTLVNRHSIPLRLPFHLFSCLELTHLKLENCLLHPSPTFCGFPNLLSLYLHMVHFESGKFGEFITRCPQLELIEVVADYRHCPILEINPDDIAKLGNLKKLILPLCELENNAITTSGIFWFLGSLSKLEELVLDFQQCEAVVEAVIRKWAPTTFPCLNKLKLSEIDIGSVGMLSCVFGMIWCSPNLQELTISAKYKDVAPPPAFSLLDEDNNTMEQLQLRNVRFSWFRGSENELCLIKSILVCSPLLKKIELHLNSSLVFGGDKGKLMFVSKLLELPRASSIAQIKLC